VIASNQSVAGRALRINKTQLLFWWKKSVRIARQVSSFMFTAFLNIYVKFGRLIHLYNWNWLKKKKKYGLWKDKTKRVQISFKFSRAVCKNIYIIAPLILPKLYEFNWNWKIFYQNWKFSILTFLKVLLL